MVSIVSVERLGNERVTESEGGRAVSVRRCGRNKIAKFIQQVESKHLYHPVALNERQKFVVGNVLHLSANYFVRPCTFIQNTKVQYESNNERAFHRPNEG